MPDSQNNNPKNPTTEAQKYDPPECAREGCTNLVKHGDYGWKTFCCNECRLLAQKATFFRSLPKRRTTANMKYKIEG